MFLITPMHLKGGINITGIIASGANWKEGTRILNDILSIRFLTNRMCSFD